MIFSISKMSIVLCINIYSLISHNSLFMIHSDAIFFHGLSCLNHLWKFNVSLETFFFYGRIWLYIPGFPSTYFLTQVVLCLAIFLPHSPEYCYYRHVWMLSLIFCYWIRNYNPINFYGFDTSKHHLFKYFCAFHIWSRIIIYK